MLNCCDHIGTNTTIRNEPCCVKTPYNNVTHVIFNLDGTLVDTNATIRDVLKEICERYQKHFPRRLYERTDGMLVVDIARLLIEEVELPVMEEEFITLFNDLFKDKCSKLSLMPGAQRLIRHLHRNQVPTAAITSSCFELKESMIQCNSIIFSLLSHIVCGGSDLEVENGKPAPDIYKVCASRFGEETSPCNCLVFESSFNGVKAALAADMQVVIIPDETVSYDVWKLATMRADSLEEVPIQLFGLPSLRAMELPMPDICFEIEWKKERKPQKVWEKIRAEVREEMEWEEKALM